MRTALLLAIGFATSQAFFFGGGSSCGCSAPPACPPPPPPSPCGGGGGGYARAYSAPTFAAGYPQQPLQQPLPSYQAAAPASFGSSYAAPAPFAAQPQYFASQPAPPQPIVAPPQGYAAPHKRHIINDMEDTGVDQTEGYVARVKRDEEAVFDPKCNSEDLKAIIIANINESTAVAKRQIQSAAADAIGGRVDVICSKGTFSYIVNTELYCETEKDGTTCFAFKQSS
ncbi:CRE-GRL-5 protein [Caenorhabditis remanei]|uniref:CRE-GRL-5 protein n=1 Tax=Caenorhabditis remanei TaxID=31234 RepID=E3LKK6_CAERE|nr:CRE-GRL-5 protein [Caenorhabditis remanei]